MSAKEKITALRFRAEDARDHCRRAGVPGESQTFHAAALVLAGLEALAEALEKPAPEPKRFIVVDAGTERRCPKCHVQGCNGGAGCANLGDER